MSTTLLIDETPALVIAAEPRRTVTLQVDEVVRGLAVQTSEFELPDAEFEYTF